MQEEYGLLSIVPLPSTLSSPRGTPPETRYPSPLSHTSLSQAQTPLSHAAQLYLTNDLGETSEDAVEQRATGSPRWPKRPPPSASSSAVSPPDTKTLRLSLAQGMQLDWSAADTDERVSSRLTQRGTPNRAGTSTPGEGNPNPHPTGKGEDHPHPTGEGTPPEPRKTST